MARYAYQHTIDFDADETLDPRGRAILKAALAVATHAHAGQSRKKLDPQWQYICHPIMVYDIMRKLGEKDPIVLAAALLHDSIEDNSRFRANDIELGDALSRELFEQGIDEMSAPLTEPAFSIDEMTGENHRVVDDVMALCREVTNPEVFDGDGIKENYQIDRIDGMSLNAKKIKMVDQAASLICNLTMPNDPQKFSAKKEMEFAEKAYALGVGIFESVQGDDTDREALEPYASLFGKVMLHAYPLVDTRDDVQKAQIREGFDFEKLIESGRHVDILPAKVKAVERLSLANDEHKSGITWVDFDKDGKVIGYAMWTAWDQPAGEANTMQKRMTSAIRTMRQHARDGGFYSPDGGVPHRVLLMPRSLGTVVDEHGNRLRGIERVFQLTPLHADAFAAAAKGEGAITREGWEQIRETGAAVKRTQEEIESDPIRHHRINQSPLAGRWFD